MRRSIHGFGVWSRVFGLWSFVSRLRASGVGRGELGSSTESQMPLIVHPDLKVPAPDARIWRFMSLEKLLDSHAITPTLLQCRGDSFDDDQEGSADDQVRAMSDPVQRNKRIAWHAQRRGDYYVTCWHLSEHEPAEMWELYGGGRTVVLRLRQPSNGFASHSMHGPTSRLTSASSTTVITGIYSDSVATFLLSCTNVLCLRTRKKCADCCD